MNVSKLRYRTAGEHAALLQRFAAVLDGWQSAWSLDAAVLEHSAGRVGVAPRQAAPGTRSTSRAASVASEHDAGWRTLGLDANGAPAAFYRLAGATSQELAAAWLGLPAQGVQRASAEAVPLSVQLAQRAYDALLTAVAVEIGCVSTGDTPAGDACRASLRAWNGAVQLTSSGSGVAVQWLLSAATADRLLPSAAAREKSRAAAVRETVVPLADALAGGRLTLAVETEPVALSLGELAGLHVGDVISLGHRLDAPLNVIDASGNTLFSGFLHARDARKVLKLHAESNR
ncbi:FliM/FliN family flagellar motor C-terminal domain-containing protein [Paraburkholderia ferrariae]|uniref:FliM/FliN family flagellar motor C-terminal domain-containing protein n=1 Tax=Paraburkholderia ferrariae TaxID=386056 RepID=A0ABU9RME1_9BURK